jgi:hypothetical protein
VSIELAEEEARMIAKKCVLAFATVVLMWPVLAAAEEGRPATAADLSGKSICWDGGRLVTTYYADGRELNNHGKHSVWSVPEPGLVKYGPAIRYLPLVVLPNGRVQSHRFFGVATQTSSKYIDHWGTFCN